MNIRAEHKYLKSSPKKVRFVAKSIKGLTPIVAMSRLLLTRNRSAKLLHAAIKSAVDNGVNAHKLVADNMRFDEIRVDEGVFLRRIRPGARGMAKPYHRRTCHITITLKNEPSIIEKTKPEAKKKDDKAEVSKKKVISKKKINGSKG